VEVISIINNSVSLVDKSIPLLPQGLKCLSGVQLSNGDLLLSGGRSEYETSNDYLHFKIGTNRWEKVGSISSIWNHSSVLLEDCMFTTGGYYSSDSDDEYGQWYGTASDCDFSLNEKFSIEDGVKDKKRMPIELSGHTATKFGQHKMIVCGGSFYKSYSSRANSSRTLIYDCKEDVWTEGPQLLTGRADHSSCAIQSDDGSIQCIIIIGGETDSEKLFSKTTEILNLKDEKWIPGPSLPLGISNASCVALPPTTNFACVLIGGQVGGQAYEGESWPGCLSNVYGLNRTLTEWKLIGKISRGRRQHIALPFS